MQRRKSLVTRGFALLLAVVFCLGLTPLAAVTAYAEDAAQEQTEPAAEEETPEESPAVPETPEPESSPAAEGTEPSAEPDTTETPAEPPAEPDTTEEPAKSPAQPETTEKPAEPELPAEKEKAPELPTPEGWVRIDPARLLAVLGEGREISITELFELAVYAYHGEIRTDVLRLAGEGLDETVPNTAEAAKAFTQPLLLAPEGLYCGGISAALFFPEATEEENAILWTDGGGSIATPLALGDRVQGATTGGGNYFGVGMGDGTWTNLQMTDHYITDNGVEYVAYCVKTYWPGPNEGMTEGEINFSARVKTGIQAILDHGYPYGSTTLEDAKARYCTAFAVAKWCAMNSVAGCDPVYAGWNNFQVYDPSMQTYIDDLISKAQNGQVSGAGEAKYYLPDSWDKQILVANRESKATVNISKSSAVPDMTAGNSCYSLAGAVYGVYSDAACTTLVERITTDASGHAASGKLQRGVYYVKEISPSPGYLLDSTVYTADAGSGDVTVSVKETPGNDPVGISITKITDDPATTLPSLEGTQFTVKFYGGQYTSVEDLPATPARTWVIETKALTVGGKTIYRTALNEDYKVSGDDFYYHQGIIIVPLGTLTVQETKAAEGYTTTGGYVTQGGTELADADGLVILNVTEDKMLENGAKLNYGNEYTKEDKPIYGGVSIQKRDAETGEAQAQGSASLAGAKLSILSLNEKDVTVDGQVFSKGQAVYSGETDENGLFQTAADLLPMGKYKLVETAAPEGYQLAGTLEQEFEISQDGVLVDLTGADSSILDRPIRADFSLKKQDGDSKEPMADVLFEITSSTTGESHTFTTDENGFFSSAGSDLRFGSAGDGGALLYDTYIIRELPCDANKGYTLAEPITLTATGENTLIQIVGVYNYKMSVSTEASFVGSADEKWELAAGTVTVRDAVSYDNFKPGMQCTLVSSIWNRTDGEFLMNEDGETLTWENGFTSRRSGETAVELSFTADGLAGKDIVVFQTVYREGSTEPLMVHADPDDEAQTLHFLQPGIKTKVTDAKTGTNVSFMEEEITVSDEIDWWDLIPNRKYTAVGVFIDPVTGEKALDAEGNEITAEKEFTALDAESSVSLTFQFKGNFETAKKFVLFEELYYKGSLIAVHADVDDEAQTLYIPKIRTTALVPITGQHLGLTADKLIIRDTVYYEGMKPGEECVISGQVADSAAPDVILGGAIKTFTPEAENGEVSIDLQVSAKDYAGKLLSVLETLLINGQPVAEHRDVNDEEQRISIPEIGTTATDSETGAHWAIADEDVTIGDKVKVKNLIPGLEYTLKGWAVRKSDTGIVMAENELSFTAEESTCEVTMDFRFDGSELGGDAVVVFETLYYNGVEIAVHHDPNDEGQTVVFPAIKTELLIAGEKTAPARNHLTAMDSISCINFPVGEELTAVGVLMDPETGKPALDGNGKEIHSELPFTVEDPNQTVWLTFEFNGENMKGKTLVAFDRIYLGTDTDGQPIAVHEDMDSEEQSIRITSTAPKTGDESSLALWAALAALSLAAAGAAALLLHRRKEQ